MEWSDVRTFLTVARSGSLRSAARELGVSQPTVGRRLQALEASLGLPLFERRRDGHRLTSAGAELLPAAEAMATAAGDLNRKRHGLADEATGNVRLSVSEWTSLFLADRLAVLRRDLPGIDVEITVSERTSSLARYDADIAVRHGLPVTGDFVTAKIGYMASAIYGGRDYVERHPASATEARYETCDWIAFSEAQAHYYSERWLAERLGGKPVAVRLSQTNLIRDAVAAGAGLGILPCYFGDADRRMMRVSAPIDDLLADYWLIVHRDLARLPWVRQVADWIKREFRACEPRLLGRRND